MHSLDLHPTSTVTQSAKITDTMVSVSQPIFCCKNAVHVNNSISSKLHNDPNRRIHNAILPSFLAFAGRRQRASTVMSLVLGVDTALPVNQSPCTSISLQTSEPAPVLLPEALQDNPLTPYTPYVIHLMSRHDFGAVFSHRYFVCPLNLNDDWTEATLEQWFAKGEQFKLKAEKWDMKCEKDAKFFRLTLRPNLAMREGFCGFSC